MRRLAPILLAAAALPMLASHASAEEVFLCPDGSLVRVDSRNRAERYELPCVKKWFENNEGKRTRVGSKTTSASKGAGASAAGAKAEGAAGGDPHAREDSGKGVRAGALGAAGASAASMAMGRKRR